MPELSLKYYTQIMGEEGHISIQTPLIPVKYQIRKYEQKRRKHPQQEIFNRTIIYFQNIALNEWMARIHMEGEEVLTFTRKLLNHLVKTDPAGLKLLLENMSLDKFLKEYEE